MVRSPEILLVPPIGLDHLAWQLVFTSGGTTTNRTEFPVFKDEEEFKRKAAARSLE
jgi:hypothetical protein